MHTSEYQLSNIKHLMTGPEALPGGLLKVTGELTFPG